MESANDILIRYLQDAIALEKALETQLYELSKEGELDNLRRFLSEHAQRTRTQYDRLSRRLEQLGGRSSRVKGVLVHLFIGAAKLAQTGQEKSDRLTQSIIMIYAIENGEVAMYEALAIAAARAGDIETENVAREIQKEERAAVENVWEALQGTAFIATGKLDVANV